MHKQVSLDFRMDLEQFEIRKGCDLEGSTTESGLSNRFKIFHSYLFSLVSTG